MLVPVSDQPLIFSIQKGEISKYSYQFRFLALLLQSMDTVRGRVPVQRRTKSRNQIRFQFFVIKEKIKIYGYGTDKDTGTDTIFL